jgi:hypothetical protein
VPEVLFIPEFFGKTNVGCTGFNQSEIQCHHSTLDMTEVDRFLISIICEALLCGICLSKSFRSELYFLDFEAKLLGLKIKSVNSNA